jgi:molybdopterin converting factor small subunit
MEVVIRLHPGLKRQIGTEEIHVRISETETLDTLMMKISRRHPRLVEFVLDPTTGELRQDYTILLNGRRMRDIHTKLKHKDEISIAPPEKA